MKINRNIAATKPVAALRQTVLNTNRSRCHDEKHLCPDWPLGRGRPNPETGRESASAIWRGEVND